MRAFTKIAGAPIGDRSVVARAGIVVYLDETLLDDSWDAELADGGLMLLNTRRAVDDPRVVAIDADGISAAVLGRPIPNTVFLGAIPAVCGAVSLEDVHEGIRATMPVRLHEKNMRIVDAAFEALASRPDLPHLGGLGQRGGDSGTGLFDLAAAVLLEGEGRDA